MGRLGFLLHQRKVDRSPTIRILLDIYSSGRWAEARRRAKGSGFKALNDPLTLWVTDSPLSTRREYIG
jgi:hypothetical protein